MVNIDSFTDFIERVNAVSDREDLFILYRGQKTNVKMLPKIARGNHLFDSTSKEIDMLNELKRRSFGLIDSIIFLDDWDWLSYAQHFGLATRLLDWTSNPLVALFFACQECQDSDSYVYILIVDKSEILDRNKYKNPFKIMSTKVFRPAQNNERVIAQSGWFTAHAYSTKYSRFVYLNTNIRVKDRIVEFKIKGTKKKDFLNQLNIFGINFQTMFPDSEGLCKQINWESKKACP